MSDEQWQAVRTLLGSREAYAAALGENFSTLTDDQKRALRKGLTARGRRVPQALRV